MAVSLKITVTQNSQNIPNNSSNITVNLYAYWTNGSYNVTEPAPTGTLTINGTTYNFSSTFNYYREDSGNQIIFTKTVTLYHNYDGNKTAHIGATYNSGTASGKVVASYDKALSTIPRAATLTDAPNFNDEQNPTITYSSPAGNSLTSLQACIADSNGSTIFVPYRDITKTGTSYTFNLSNAERATLQNATKNSNTLTVKFYIKSVIGSNTYYSSLAKTLTIVNAAPTMSPTAVDNGTRSKELTGNPSGTIIKGYNSMTVACNATALKGATITSYKISNGGKSINTASGTLSWVDTNTFTFTVTDSRGNTTTQTLKKTLINYVKLTCNITPSAPTTSGVMAINISGNCFNGSFGAATNSLTVHYRIKPEGGSYSDWTLLTATKSGNTYKATGSKSGLDYKTSYTIQARAMDAIYNDVTEPAILTPERVVKTTPVFDWGANDFDFNVPVSFNAGYTAPTKVLWSGGYYMHGTQQIILPETLSNQANGIVLAWSAYSGGEAKNFDWHFTYIPKQHTAVASGAGICTGFMVNSDFTQYGSKYIYVDNNSIKGHANNSAAVAGNGFNFNNAYWVLRYVIGV